MSSDETVSFSLELNIEEAMVGIRKVQAGINRIISILRQYIGDPTIDGALAKLQDFLIMVNQVRLALAALDAATLTSPSGILLAGVAAISAFVSLDQMIRRPRFG